MPFFDPSHKYVALAPERVLYEASSHQSLDWLICQHINSTKCTMPQKQTMHGYGLSCGKNHHNCLNPNYLITNKNHFHPSPFKWINIWWRAWGGWGGWTGTTQGLWSIIAIAITPVTRLTITLQWHPAKPSLRRSRPFYHSSVSWAKSSNSMPLGNKGGFDALHCQHSDSGGFRN